jgi:hypothetical protein
MTRQHMPTYAAAVPLALPMKAPMGQALVHLLVWLALPGS